MHLHTALRLLGRLVPKQRPATARRLATTTRRAPEYRPAGASPSAASRSDLWRSYRANGRGSCKLFEAIDVNGSGSLSPLEVQGFVESVDRSGVNATAWHALEAMSEDHELSLEEFRKWLVAATKFAPETDGIVLETSRAVEESATKESYAINASNMSQALRRMQYAVRGEVVMRADALEAEGRKILYTNVGNPHSVGQKPLTFFRQVLALCDLPEENGVDHPAASSLFPSDAVDRAREARAAVGAAGTGSYTNSQGVAAFRQDVADFIEKRDGHAARPEDVFLTNGASSAIQHVLTATFATDHDALMIPIPQYPIYSALVALLGGRQVGYELDEEAGWAVTEEELESRLRQSRADGLTVKAMAVINPGNPTGQVMDRASLEACARFCSRHSIVLLSDEVYQRNVYDETKEFVSMKKVAVESVPDLELVSFHSTSKGFIGECGRRGGYMEMYNIDPYVHSQIYKLASSGLCSGVAGQIMTSLMVRPPRPGDASYESHAAEEAQIYESLKRRATLMVDGLNAIPGISCQKAEGAMYAFPSVEMPPKAVAHALANGVAVDNVYALSLLEATGICVVPASGFGQKAGRAGFRTTFLPAEEALAAAVEQFASHHAAFCAEWA
mmetsp:Transcript_9560/g.29663  ORF Transcript_9560/g.29663 Transcript_9560/m.29663 type:complete len:618 (+) Transcript_9560:131-1984(+)